MPPRLQYSVTRSFGSPGRQPHRVAARSILVQSPRTSPKHRPYATAARGLPLPSALQLPDDYVPPTQPPSARRPEERKSQLLRTYTSLLRSTPLMLIFQHSNLTALEWAAVRRELRFALANVSAVSGSSTNPRGANTADRVASSIKLEVVRTRIFDVALKVVEFFDPASVPAVPFNGPKPKRAYNHDLSAAANEAIRSVKTTEDGLPGSSLYAQLSPLLVGPLALVTFPTVSPAHLAAVLSILAPNPPSFSPPARKKNPGYYDPVAQNGLAKLILIGGRVEGKVFDIDGVRWVGGIDGGLETLRAQLVSMLQSTGLGLTSALEGAGKSLWLTVESRKAMLEEKGKSDKDAAKETET